MSHIFLCLAVGAILKPKYQVLIKSKSRIISKSADLGTIDKSIAHSGFNSIAEFTQCLHTILNVFRVDNQEI